MKLKISDDSLIIFVYILSFVMLFGQFMGISVITSLAFTVSFVVVFAIWCLHIKKAGVLDILAIFIIALSFIGVIATYTTLSVSYFYNWLMFAAVFLYFSVCFKIKIKKSTLKTLFVINFLVGLSCLIAYILRYNDAYYVTNIGVRYLTFDFYNPNSLAIFLVVITITGMQFFSLYKLKFRLLIEICFIGVFLFFIFQTLSRTSLLVIAFFMIISIVFSRKKHYYIPQNGLFKFLVTVFPLLFALFYMLVIDYINSSGFLSFLVSEGKGLDSREYVWKYAFELFQKSPLIGSYGYLATESEFSHLHNSHINILVSYGVVVFALVMVFIYIALDKSLKKSKGTQRAFAAWAFIVCLVLGAGESILFSGGLSFYLLVGQFLLVINADEDNRGELGL